MSTGQRDGVKSSKKSAEKRAKREKISTSETKASGLRALLVSLTPTYPARHVRAALCPARVRSSRCHSETVLSRTEPGRDRFRAHVRPHPRRPSGAVVTTAGGVRRGLGRERAGASAVRLSHAVPCGASTARGRVVERVSASATTSARLAASLRTRPRLIASRSRLSTVVPRAAPGDAGACAQTTDVSATSTPSGFPDLIVVSFLSLSPARILRSRVSPPASDRLLPLGAYSFRLPGRAGFFSAH